MKWVDRYLHAVANHLPEESREDIKEELRVSLYEQMEEQSEALGRDLSEEEQQALLKKLGHPMKVAAGYLPQQYLIGPALYPYFKYILKLVIGIVIAVHVGLTVVAIFTGSETMSEMPGLLSRLFYSAIIALGCVTGGFVIAEYSGEKIDWFETWNPSSLPPFPNLRIGRTDNIFNLVFETIGLLWWNNIIGFTDAMTVEGSIWHIGLSEGWLAFYWPVNLILIGAIVLHVHHLFSEYWTVPKISIDILLDVATVVVLYFLAQLDPFIVFKEDITTLSERGQRFVELLELNMGILLLLLALMVMYELYKHGKILYQMKHEAA